VDLRPNFSALRRLGFDHPILISCGTLTLGYAVVRRVCSPHGRSRSPERALFTPASFCKLRSTGLRSANAFLLKADQLVRLKVPIMAVATVQSPG